MTVQINIQFNNKIVKLFLKNLQITTKNYMTMNWSKINVQFYITGYKLWLKVLQLLCVIHHFKEVYFFPCRKHFENKFKQHPITINQKTVIKLSMLQKSKTLRYFYKWKKPGMNEAKNLYLKWDDWFYCVIGYNDII